MILKLKQVDHRGIRDNYFLEVGIGDGPIAVDETK